MQDYDKVLDTIYDLVDNYPEKVEEYAAYAASILSEKEEFYEEVDSMLDIIRENVKVQYPLWKGNKYDVLFERMQVIAAKIYSTYKNAKGLYASKEVDSAINELLKAESSFDTSPNLLPNFAARVLSMHRKTGCDSNCPEVRFSEMDVVTFMNCE